MKTCCFIGHKNIKRRKFLIDNLVKEIEYLINQGYKKFIFGSFGTFDSLAYVVCLGLKNTYKDIEIIQVFPDFEIKDTLDMPKSKTQYLYLPFQDDIRKCSLVLYKEMINRSDFIVCYVNQKRVRSNAKEAYEYALSINKNIKNIFN